jgi:rod shape-determining protein MreD
MDRMIFAPMLALTTLIWVTILPEVFPLEVLPNLVLVLLLVWSALHGVAEGVIWAFAAGLLLDFVSLDPLGTNGLALLPVVLLAGFARRPFFHSRLIFPIMFAVAATAANVLVTTLLRTEIDGVVVDPGSLVRLTLLQALLNALLVPPLYLVAGWVHRLSTERA